MSGMIDGHAFEDGADEVVLQDFFVKDPEEVLKSGFASGPSI
jgi:hypothetical protein